MSAVINKPKMILIDVDGTLVDSVPDLTYCVDEMMKTVNMPRRGEADVRNWVGNGVESLVRASVSGVS
jgi:phosphoglycolate phosphatase